MKDSGVSTDNRAGDMYNHLISEDDNELSIAYPHQSHPQTRQEVVNGPSLQTYRVTTVILGILCAVLMSATIGLYVSYRGHSEKHIILSQNLSLTNSNLEQLKANYDLLTAALMKLQKNFQEAVSAKNMMQLESYKERQLKDHLQKEKDNLMSLITKQQTHIDVLEKSCERCPAGWVLLHSSCYFFSTMDTSRQLSWHQSRVECKKSGADLAVIDSQEKQEFITRILKTKSPSYRSWHVKGYWIGLIDIETEGIWKWLNGTELTKGFWFDGEPNDQYSLEDCAATYPQENPLKTWNDAPCDFALYWLCEKKLQEP